MFTTPVRVRIMLEKLRNEYCMQPLCVKLWKFQNKYIYDLKSKFRVNEINYINKFVYILLNNLQTTLFLSRVNNHDFFFKFQDVVNIL